MNWAKVIRYGLIVLIVVGAILDIYTTWPYQKFETNPIYFIFNSLWPLIGLKIGLITIMIWLMVKANHNNVIYYTVIMFIVVFSFAQLSASLNNYRVGKDITESYTPVEIESIEIDPQKQMESYIDHAIPIYGYILSNLLIFLLYYYSRPGGDRK